MNERYTLEQRHKWASIGGSRKVKKGFACNIELARKAGAKGGAISKRGSKKNVF